MAREGKWGTRVYNSVDADPEIEILRAAFQKEPIFRNSELAVLAGLHSGTINNLLGGKTKRPQHATFAKAFGAMGHEYKAVKVDKPDYQNELIEARAQFKEHRAALKKKLANKRKRGK